MSVLIPPIPFQYEKSEEAAKYIMDIGENPPDEFTDVRKNLHTVINKHQYRILFTGILR